MFDAIVIICRELLELNCCSRRIVTSSVNVATCETTGYRRLSLGHSWMMSTSPSLKHSPDLADSRLHPPLAALGEDGLEVAFKEGAGVLEVLFGVGFGGGDAVKRFVEDADDPLLFGERGKRN